MRYMFLIYTRESDQPVNKAQQADDAARRHWAVMDEATARGIFHGAAPLRPTSTATTVRMQAGTPLITDGPFAETKEQLAGYYILDCEDLDEAIQWAARIPTTCTGGNPGCVEIRPIAPLTPR